MEFVFSITVKSMTSYKSQITKNPNESKSLIKIDLKINHDWLLEETLEIFYNQLWTLWSV